MVIIYLCFCLRDSSWSRLSSLTYCLVHKLSADAIISMNCGLIWLFLEFLFRDKQAVGVVAYLLPLTDSLFQSVDEIKVVLFGGFFAFGQLC